MWQVAGRAPCGFYDGREHSLHSFFTYVFSPACEADRHRWMQRSAGTKNLLLHQETCYQVTVQGRSRLPRVELGAELAFKLLQAIRAVGAPGRDVS